MAPFTFQSDLAEATSSRSVPLQNRISGMGPHPVAGVREQR
jgi:hypothetical protein